MANTQIYNVFDRLWAHIVAIIPTKFSQLENDMDLGKVDIATSTTPGSVLSGGDISVASDGTVTIASASTSQAGKVKLSSATDSTSTSLAATASAVKAVYDLANSKTDINVTQTVSTTDGNFPLLLRGTSAGTSTTTTTTSFATAITANPSTGSLTATAVYGAVWNDYAEYREADCIEPGRVVCENGDDTLSLASERLQPGANIISDTFGFAIGETEKAKTPIAVAGRVLAYPFEDRDFFCPGDAVCAGPNGTVSKMTREEIMMYPERVVGTVSAIPNYKTWGQNNVLVDNRIWIKVK